MKKIIIHKSKDGRYYFTVVAANNQVIVTSETYTRKANCKAGIWSLNKLFTGKPWLRNDIDVIDTTKKIKQ